MIDFRLIDNDIAIEGNDIATIDNDAATRQRLVQKLQLWKGEWFLNTDAGFPYLQQVLGQTPRPEVVSSLLRQLILNDEGVDAVQSLKLNYDNVKRELSARFRAKLTNANTEDIEVTL